MTNATLEVVSPAWEEQFPGTPITRIVLDSSYFGGIPFDAGTAPAGRPNWHPSHHGGNLSNT